MMKVIDPILNHLSEMNSADFLVTLALIAVILSLTILLAIVLKGWKND